MTRRLIMNLFNREFEKKDTVVFTENVYSTIYESDDTILIVDTNLTERPEGKELFSYEEYTTSQNRIFNRKKRVYRIIDGEENTLCSYFEDEKDYSSTYRHSSGDRGLDTTALEYYFEERFAECYGSDATKYLFKEYPITGGDGNTFYLDYCVEMKDGERVGVEENGVKYHHPQLIGLSKYRHQLEKQNLCSFLGIRLYRFSSIDCQNPNVIIENIEHFFGPKENFIAKSLTATRKYKLYEHQEVKLSDLENQRNSQGDCSSLIVLPTGSGKSLIVEEDIKKYLIENPEARILIVAPTRAIRDQWNHVKSLSDRVECGTYHMLWSKKNAVPKDYYDYIVVDEAHHATSPMTKIALQYFTPHFLLGVTATPTRMDGQKLEEVFGSYQTSLTLKEAIKKNIISNVRAYRLQSNLDLSEVRYNGKDYVNRDLESKIIIPSRDYLIIDLLKKYFNSGEPGSLKGIIFCINISHANRMAKLLNEAGFSAQSLSSKSKNPKDVLDSYKRGEFRFLCSCNAINEGFDDRNVGILVMARPTLSKVLYLQQLGRGLRKGDNKDEVFVIDVVDSYGATVRPWSANAIFKEPKYRPFSAMVQTERAPILNLEGYEETLRDVIPIDITTFEDEYSDLLSSEKAARKLYIGTETLHSWIKNKKVIPERSLNFGRNKIYYFTEKQVEEIRVQEGLKKHSDETIREDFFEYIKDKNYTYSFKIVFLLSLLQVVDSTGAADIDDVLKHYVRFYLRRIEMNRPVDRESCVYDREYLLDTIKMKRNMLKNPFEKYERKRFIYYGKDIKLMQINPQLWYKLSEGDIEQIKKIERENLESYYRDLGGICD